MLPPSPVHWLTAWPLFLPLPTTPDELLFVTAVSIGALAILFGLHPEVVLGITYVGLVIYFANLLGPHPMLAALIIGTAAFARLLGLGGQSLRNLLHNAGPETMVAAAGVLEVLITRWRGGREDDEG